MHCYAPTESDAMPSIETHEVNAARWSDFERLFEAPGAPKYCWCMVWRRDENGRSPQGRPARKEAMRRKVADGGRVGILAYLDGEPAAWRSVAPRSSFVRIGGVHTQDEDESRVWSISCFYVPRRLRRDGLMRRLIEAAAAHARANGAAVLEAYPVALDSPSYRFCGFAPVFAALGFAETGKAGTRRRVMRRALT